MKVGVVVHAGRDESFHAAVEAARLLRDLGVDVSVARPADGDGDDHLHELSVIGRPHEADAFAAGLDVAVSFGGDGTFLRAAHLCRNARVPVLGVNLGRLGFLAEIDVDDVAPALRAVVTGDFSVEERPTLEVSVTDAADRVLATGWALNEVSIEKTARQRLLRMDVHIDGTLFAEVPADALVISSSTGSTAYALSAGGPIVSPRLPATLVVPVAPHSLFDRTVVAGPEEAVRVDLRGDQAPAVVSCDGRDPVMLAAGGAVTVVGGGEAVRLARVGVLDFYTLVRRKFGLR